MAIRVIISDVDTTLVHGHSVLAAINEGYGSNISDQVEIRIESMSSSLTYAQSIGAIAVVRSTTGIANYVNTTLAFYPSIMTFMPFTYTANDGHVEIFILESIPTAIVTTSGLIAGYGQGLEFLDTTAGGLSGANGRVAGKLLKIRDGRGGNWADARAAADRTASNQSWNKVSGFGFINNVDAAIVYGRGNPFHQDKVTINKRIVERTVYA